MNSSLRIFIYSTVLSICIAVVLKFVLYIMFNIITYDMIDLFVMSIIVGSIVSIRSMIDETRDLM